MNAERRPFHFVVDINPASGVCRFWAAYQDTVQDTLRELCPELFAVLDSVSSENKLLCEPEPMAEDEDEGAGAGAGAGSSA